MNKRKREIISYVVVNSTKNANSLNDKGQYGQINKTGGDVECAGDADSTAAAARTDRSRNETEAELVAAVAAVTVLFLASRPSACKHPIELVTVHWRRTVTEPAEDSRTGRQRRTGRVS